MPEEQQIETQNAALPGATPGGDMSKRATNWFDWIRWMFGTSFGLGLAPIAPGTFGTLPAVVLYLLIAAYVPEARQTFWIAFSWLMVCLLTLAWSPWAERYWGKKDPGNYVPDELAGFLTTVTLWRVDDPISTAVWAFFVTRIIDIVKPPPARQLEALPGGWGILVDDLVTSLMAVVLLYIFTWTMPPGYFMLGL